MHRISDFRFWIVDWRGELAGAVHQRVNPKSKIHNPKSAAVWLAVISCLWPARAMACPLCKESLFDPAQLQQKLSLARGYALSITLLLVVPLVLVAGIATLIVRAHRRKQHV